MTTNGTIAVNNPLTGCVCAGERPSAPDGSPSKRGFYSVAPIVAALELETVDKASDRTLCLTCPHGGRCQNDGLGINNISALPGFWRSHPNNSVFHLCLGDGSDCLAGGCQQGHAGPVCSLCDMGYARRNGTALPCGKCPLGQGAGNDTTLPLIGFLMLAFLIIFILFLIYLSWPDGEFQKKQDRESETDGGDSVVEDASQKEDTHKTGGEEEDEDEEEEDVEKKEDEEEEDEEDGGEVKIIVDLVKEEMVGRVKDHVIGQLVDATGDSSGAIDNADAEQKQKIKKKADKKSKQQLHITKGVGKFKKMFVKIFILLDL